MLATEPNTPQSIETIKVRKDQFDTEDPGEQSLSGWWRRSQASFHEGAGARYQESSTENAPGNGFWESSGVDVFTKGRLTLLKKMALATVAGADHTRIRCFGVSSFSAIADGELHTAPAGNGSYTALHDPVGKVLVDGLISGDSFYDVADDGTLYEGLVSSPGAATTWPCGATPSRLAWGKHRLWIIGGRKLWQPDLSLAAATNQDPIFEHPNQGWTYTAIAEGPAAMYFAGHDGRSSSIQAVTLEAGGGVPTLSGASVTAVLPDGELVQELAVIAGQYLCIGTTRGVRVGIINADTSIVYGPLIVEPEGVTGCSAATSQGRFFLVAFETLDGNAMAYKIDTSVPIGDGGVFAYAADIDCEIEGTITSIAGNSAGLVVTASTGAVYYQSETEYVDSGFITSGRIRFRTTEQKAFRKIGLGIEPLQGNLAVSIVKDDGSALPVGSATSQGDVLTDDFNYDGVPMEFASIKVVLTPTEDNLNSPVITSTLVKALPAVTPQRLITLPLLCFDKEQSRSGQNYGADNYSKDRLAALMLLEDGAEPLTFQDFLGGAGNYIVIIESLKFVQTSVARDKRRGGVLLVELRTVGV